MSSYFSITCFSCLSSFPWDYCNSATFSSLSLSSVSLAVSWSNVFLYCSFCWVDSFLSFYTSSSYSALRWPFISSFLVKRSICCSDSLSFWQIFVYSSVCFYFCSFSPSIWVWRSSCSSLPSFKLWSRALILLSACRSWSLRAIHSFLVLLCSTSNSAFSF